jgi:glycosyltransferase involved in cell wall biosynthesis
VTQPPRVLLTIGTDAQRDAREGPRRDYIVLADRLGATILDRTETLSSPISRVIARFFGSPSAQAWSAFRRRQGFDVIVTDGEHVGIPLGLLLRLTRSKVRHVTIGHRLSSPKKRLFFTLLGAHRRIDRIALHSRRQMDFAASSLLIGRDRLALIPYQVDTAFWAPTAVPEERLVVSAGLEHRDYETLFRAADGLDAAVVIGAASRWSRHTAAKHDLPPNVTVGSFSYADLRDLYARAAVVVVPLADVDNQAGVTTILEAMAMGKAVVVTQSVGQTDVVLDRRDHARPPLRPRTKSLSRMIAEEIGVPVEPNGFYVAPGDADALRRALAYLLDHPDDRRRLGFAGRRLAERLFSVEQFAERMSSLVGASADDGRIAAQFRPAHG